VGYNNLWLAFRAVPQNREWVKAPYGFNSSWAFRHKSDKGLFKSYLQYQGGGIGMRTPDLSRRGAPMATFRNDNQDWYWNNSYRGTLGEKWSVFGGLSLSINHNDNQFDIYKFGSEDLLGQAKVTLGRDLGEHVYLKVGGETHWRDELINDSITAEIKESYSAVFGEAQIKLSRKIALRIGTRGEYSNLLNQYNVAPRASFAMKTGKNSQLALAYGHFYQGPQTDYLRQTTDLGYERSTHYILNYQWLTDYYTFRVEVYQKQYDNLVKNYTMEVNRLVNDILVMDSVGSFNNAGRGHSRGIDVFWRDRLKTVKNK